MEMGSYIEVCLMLLCVTCTLGKRLGCPLSCKCPEVPTCPPGSVPVPDSCGCGCTVCARGLGSGCDGFRPCDSSQNLVCDYHGDLSRHQGVCKVRQETGSCFHNVNEILHGQDFEIDCDSYCKCENGNIDCVPLCPEPERPHIPNCKEMQLVTVPGECCAQWRCLDESSGSEEEDEPGDNYPGPDDESSEAEAKTRSRREAPDPDREEDEESLEETYSCKPETEWTPCSRTCGFGNSVRIVYEKETCIPKAEKRLCMIRPCKGQYPNANYTVLKATNVCSRVMHWSHPQHLRFRDCLSSRPLLPKFCGLCSDGRLCTPSLSHTRPVSFRCAQLKKRVTRQVMWVQRCECGGKRGKRGKKKGGSTMKPREEVTHDMAGDDE
ncbi:CCN family member 5-like [Dendropsophus ebraccatus]|uniref:CCN family member 5-like n=1 Tax=Dendropsophus ebraccatus TaxID=150705 RepID=UPI0038321087